MNLLIQAGIAATAVSAIIGAAYLLRRALGSMQTVSLHAISAAVDASRTGHLVDYHLGPNDGTTPLHERVQVEAAQVSECHAAIAGAVKRITDLETSLAEHRLTE